jgi:hypothetical protein
MAYREFTKNYWKSIYFTEKYGLLYQIIKRVKMKLKASTSDPAHRSNCNPIVIDAESEPAYHFIIAH